MKHKFFLFSVLLSILTASLFAEDTKFVTEIKSPHKITAKSYENGSCSVLVKLNDEMFALYLFAGVDDDSLKKFVNLINAEYYEDKNIDKRSLTDWMNSNVCPAIELQDEKENSAITSLALSLIAKTLKFELSDFKDNVYVYTIGTSLQKYLK
ncbi:MAG: hypothetical protein J6V90_04915 [Treponema sp.]|nr:hypothetical protein [Treponema sp.]